MQWVKVGSVAFDLEKLAYFRELPGQQQSSADPRRSFVPNPVRLYFGGRDDSVELSGDDAAAFLSFFGTSQAISDITPEPGPSAP